MKYIFLVILMLTGNVFAQTGAAPKARFSVWLQVIGESLSSHEKATKVAERLLMANNRIAAFNLQALGRLYEPQDSRFSSLVRKSFKDLEDGIGECEKWIDIAEKSGKKKDQIKADEAKEKFAALLKKKNWLPAGPNSRLNEIKNFIEDFSWAQDQQDQQQVLQVLMNQLNTLAVTDYDVSRLEKEDGDGNGLHELRREIRWFLIESRVLNGMLQFENSNRCAVAQYRGLLKTDIVNGKYAQLPGSKFEKNPCLIQQCLFLGMVDSVNKLGAIKDDSEQDKASRESDQVLGPNLYKAQEVYKTLLDTQVFRKLSENMGACLK